MARVGADPSGIGNECDGAASRARLAPARAAARGSILPNFARRSSSRRSSNHPRLDMQPSAAQAAEDSLLRRIVERLEILPRIEERLNRLEENLTVELAEAALQSAEALAASSTGDGPSPLWRREGGSLRASRADTTSLVAMVASEDGHGEGHDGEGKPPEQVVSASGSPEATRCRQSTASFGRTSMSQDDNNSNANATNKCRDSRTSACRDSMGPMSASRTTATVVAAAKEKAEREHKLRLREEEIVTQELEVRQLLEQDKAFERILDNLQAAQIQHELRVRKRRLHWVKTLHPEGWVRNGWDIVMSLVLLVTCFMVPLQLAFNRLFRPLSTYVAVDFLIDGFFLVDIILNFGTGFYKDGTVLVSDLRECIHNYAKGWFIIDLISTIPFAYIFASIPGVKGEVLKLSKFFRLLKLFKLLRLVRLLKHTRLSKIVFSRTQLNPSLVRLMQLIFFLFLSWHWIACIWWFIATETAEAEAIPISTFNFIQYPSGTQGGAGYDYVTSYYWAVLVTTGLGVPVLPHSSSEAIFECVCTFLGVCMQAYMLGSAASALSNMDAALAARRRKLDSVKQYVRYKRVPMFLRERIVEYYEYVYTRVQSIDEAKVLRDLPPSLKVQLAVVLNSDFLKVVPVFKYADRRCVAILVMCMRGQIYLPQELVLQEGAVGEGLFFVRMGKLEVFRGDKDGMPKVPLSKLHVGASFGEQSFLARTPSLASVRALTYCEVMVLTNSDFESVMRLFPDLKLHVLGFQREQMDRYKTESRRLLAAQGGKGGCKPSGHTMQGAMSVATGSSEPGSFKNKPRNNNSSAVRFQEPGGPPSSQSSPGAVDEVDEVEEFQKEEDSPR